MKTNTPERVLYVLETEENEVTVDKKIAERAMLPLDRPRPSV